MSTNSWETRPLRETIREIAVAIAEGQSEFDRTVVELQRELKQAFERGQLDTPLTAQRFTFAEVDVDLRLVVSQSREPETKPGEDQPRAYKPLINATLLAPESRQTDRIDRELTSTVSARIVPVPAERPEDER